MTLFFPEFACMVVTSETRKQGNNISMQFILYVVLIILREELKHIFTATRC